MIADSVVYDPYVGRKIRRAGATVRIKEKEGMVNPRQPPAGHGPIYNVIMDVSWSHIVDVLGIVAASHRFPHTNKLARLFNNLPDIAALVDAGKLAIVNGRPVHNDGRDCPHAIIPLASCLTLNEPRKQLTGI